MSLSLDGTTGISATGNIISSGGIISATGNIYGGNIIGTIAPAAITVSGNATVGNLVTGGLVTATGTVTGSSFLGSVVSVTANITGGNVLTGGLISATSTITSAANITGGNILTGGLISAASTVTGTSHLGSVVSVTANVTGGNILTGGVVSATGNINANFFIGNGSQLSGLSASKIFNGTSEANIGASGGNANITIGGTSNVVVVATTGAYVTGIVSASGNVSGNYFIGNGSQLSGLSASKIFNGTSEANIGTSGGNANITIGGTSNVVVVATTGAYVTGLVSASGNVTAANVIISGTAAAGSGVLIVSGNIQTSTSNATANIGNASNYFNRLFAQATTALYADLAEVYRSDAQYPPGTVLVFGGSQEVTMSTASHDNKIAGIVSTHPAHVMNSGLQSEFTVEVGLIGRVPCRVIGPITAGDRVVSSNRAGVAERLDMSQYQPGVIIGKALESYSGTDVGTIEVVVGRL